MSVSKYDAYGKCHRAYAAALIHIRAARKAYRDVMAGRPCDQDTLRAALGKITELYPPDTDAGHIAAEALAREQSA